MAWTAAVVTVSAPVLSLIFRVKPQTAKGRKPGKGVKCYLQAVIVAVVVSVAGFMYIDRNCDYTKEDIFEYGYYANKRQWQNIIDKANVKSPDDPFSVSYLNLALGMTGKLADQMFWYHQNGGQGLLPYFVIDFTVPGVTAEALFNLGMVNAAQRYVYEAQEAIPDFQKSTRYMCRLAELNMLKGNDTVARQYLNTLQNTLFYDDWAREALTIIGDSAAISRHDVYGPIKAYNIKTDAFMGDNASDMLINLLADNPDNKLALDYLLAYCLLNCELNSFCDYLSLCTFPNGYTLPRHYQEALALMWVINNPSWEGLPWPLAPEIKSRMESFLRDYKSNRPADYMSQHYGNTYWLYYFNHLSGAVGSN